MGPQGSGPGPFSKPGPGSFCLAAGNKGCKKYILVLFSLRVLDMPTRKGPYFDTNGLPKAKNLRIRSFFGDLLSGEGLDPKVEVSGPKKVQKYVVPAARRSMVQEQLRVALLSYKAAFGSQGEPLHVLYARLYNSVSLAVCS